MSDNYKLLRSLRTCQRKVKYSSRERAAAVFKTRFFVGSIRTYKCDMCSGWHLGHWAQYARERSYELLMEIKRGQSDYWPVADYYFRLHQNNPPTGLTATR